MENSMKEDVDSSNWNSLSIISTTDTTTENLSQNGFTELNASATYKDSKNTCLNKYDQQDPRNSGNQDLVSSCDSNDNGIFENATIPTQELTSDQLQTEKNIVRRKRIITVVCHSILLASSTIVLITYIFVLKLFPNLDFHEMGNIWTFYLLFVSCAATIVATIFTLISIGYNKIMLNSNIIGVVDIILFLFGFAILFAPIGIAEFIKDGRSGPKHITDFGKYVVSVCGLENRPELQNVHFGVVSEFSSVRTVKNALSALDNEKCAEVDRLITSVFCMYVWAFVSIITTLVSSKLGTGSWIAREKWC